LRRRDAESTGSGNGKEPAFVPVRVVDRLSTSPGRRMVEVGLGGGRLIRIHGEFGPDDLARLVLALEAGVC
jgi:hypothetical protein